MAETVGYCARGTTIAQGAWSPAAVVPVINTMEPTEAAIGDSDMDVRLVGTFGPFAQVLVDGTGAPTIYLNSSELSFVVRPSAVATAHVATIQVLDGWNWSSVVDFAFVDPPPLTRAQRAQSACP